MNFTDFVITCDDRSANLEDFRELCKVGSKNFRPDRSNFYYLVSMEIIDDRFFWLTAEYDDAQTYRDYVVDTDTQELQANPRRKSQLEPRKQLFACFDSETEYLYLNDKNKKAFIQVYMSHSLQRKFKVSNVYRSVDEFCAHISKIRGFRFTQRDNLFGRGSDVYRKINGIFANDIGVSGLDLPKQIKLHIAYGDIPVHDGRGLIDYFSRKKSEFDDILIIGADDNDVEQTFDFSTVLRHFSIDLGKDENEYYDPEEVKQKLLIELRKQ